MSGSNVTTLRSRDCADCGVRVAGKSRGAVPARCPDCTRKHNATLTRMRGRSSGVRASGPKSTCEHCGREFHIKSGGKGLFCSHECQQAGQRMGDGPAAVRWRHAEWRATKGCVVCGITIVPILHAHHIDPDTKELDTKDIRRLDDLERELSRCVCLCSNHHRLWHYEAKRDGRGVDPESMVELLRRKY